MNAKKQIQSLFPLDKRKGYKCECCGQFIKLYSRHFNCNMGLALIYLYKNRDKGFIHLENSMVADGFKRCGDASYMLHYYLIEAMPEKRKDKSPRNGHYRISGRGILFVEGNMKVQERFLTFNNKCEGFEGEEITIQQALGKRFSFEELMSEK